MTTERPTAIPGTPPGHADVRGSDERPQRDLEPALAGFDLTSVLADLERESDGRRSITLVHRPGLRAVLALVRERQVGDQASDQDVVALAVRGSGSLEAAGRVEPLDGEHVVSVAAGTDWQIRSDGELVALLVFGGHAAGDGTSSGSDR